MKHVKCSNCQYLIPVVDITEAITGLKYCPPCAEKYAEIELFEEQQREMDELEWEEEQETMEIPMHTIETLDPKITHITVRPVRKRVNPIHKLTLMKKIRTTGTWQGYIAPNKVNDGHINDGWHLGMSIIVAADRDGKLWVMSANNEEFQELETCLNMFSYYNCNDNQTGKRIRFWEEVK